MLSTTVFTLTALLVVSASASPLVVSRQLSSAGWAYKGCFTEATGQRALIGKAYFDDLMTHEKCAAACSAFSYFGVEYGRECWCSNTGLNEGSVAAPEEECSFKCPGNLSQICGAGDRLTVYSKGSATTSSGGPAPTAPSSTYTAIGCYTDNTSGRALVDANYYDDELTVEKCAELCSPYLYYGLEYGRECRCGTTLHDSVSVSADECNFACAGNAEQKCGAGDRMSLYSLGGITPGGSSSSASASSSLSTSSSESSSTSSTESSSTSSSTTTTESTTASSTEVSTTESPSSTTLSTSESSSSISSTTTETPILSSSTVSTTESPSSTVLSTSESSSSVSSATTETPVPSSSTTTSTESPSTTLMTSSTTTTSVTTTSAAPECLVTSPIINGGFEVGGTSSSAFAWIPWSATLLGSFAVSTTERNSGLRSYRVRAPAFASANAHTFRQNAPSGSTYCIGRVYKWEAWVKLSPGIPGPVKLHMGGFNAPIVYTDVTWTQWKKVEGAFYVTNFLASGGFNVAFTFPPLVIAADIFFDDISVTLTPWGTALPPV